MNRGSPRLAAKRIGEISVICGIDSKSMKPVKLSDLIDVLEFDSDEYTQYVDLQTGRVVHLYDSLLSAVEDGDEDSLGDWEPEAVEIAKAVVEEDERFVDAPDKFEFHEYRQMERFIRTVETPEVAEQLWRAIKGKGAFRHFKDTASRLGLLERWYGYRANAMKEFVLEWAEDNHVSVVDDLTQEPHS